MSGKLVYIDSVEQALNKAYGEGNPLRIGRILNNVSAVDAVEVVRCRDCKYWGDEEGIAEGRDFLYARCNVHNHFRYGEHFGWCPKEDDFCSCGERREENEVD